MFYWSQPVAAILVALVAVGNWLRPQPVNQIEPTLAQVLHMLTLPFTVAGIILLILGFVLLHVRPGSRTVALERTLLTVEYLSLCLVLALPTIGEMTKANGLVVVGAFLLSMTATIVVGIVVLARFVIGNAKLAPLSGPSGQP